MTASGNVGVGIIGTGAMGRVYAECLCRHTQGARLIAVAGGTRAAALARDYAIERADDIEALLARRDVDAVILASPEMVHRDQTLLAAAYGKHVLVEKPMASTVRECDEMIAACDRAAVRLMVVKHWRFRGVHTRGRALLASGEFGLVRTIVNQTYAGLASSLEMVARKPFYVDPRGGGLLMGWAVHNLDWVCHLGAGTPDRVTSLSPIRSHPTLGHTHVEAEIGFSNGIAARVHISIDRPEPPPMSEVFRTRVTTEGAALDLDGYGALRVNRNGEDKTVWTQPTFDPRNPTDPLRLEAYVLMVQAFLESIRHERAPPVSGDEGRRAVDLFHRVIAAARSHLPRKI